MMRVFLNKRQLFTNNPRITFLKNTSRASVWLMEAVLHLYFFYDDKLALYCASTGQSKVKPARTPPLIARIKQKIPPSCHVFEKPEPPLGLFHSFSDEHMIIGSNISPLRLAHDSHPKI